MRKNKGKKSAGKEDILRVAQPSPAPEQAGGPGSKSLLSEAKSMGTRYWIKAGIGLLFVIFFSAFVPNAYLQYKYSNVFHESPCKLCQDLNSENVVACFAGQNYSVIPKTSWITIHPMNELAEKAAWLKLPCDVCGKVEGGNLMMCLNQTFAPKKENAYGKIKTNYSLNLSSITEGDISS